MPPPRDLDELGARVRALEGLSVAELDVDGARSQLHRKGKTGQLIERALGATAGSAGIPDFPELGVELKTVPLDARGRPTESTFLASFAVAEADTLEWQTSSLRHKLSHVLWVPIVDDGAGRRIGSPVFWRPTPEQNEVLRRDFEDLVGLVAIGRIEDLTAHLGRWLQVRPKAAHGRARTRAYGPDGPLLTLPRGFYLRARVTEALLRDCATLAFA